MSGEKVWKKMYNPQYSREEIELILTNRIRESCKTDWELPEEVWNSIIESMQEISTRTFHILNRNFIVSGEESDFIKDYGLTYLGNEAGSQSWCGIYKDANDIIYEVNRGDRMGGGRDEICILNEIPELE